MIKPQIPKGFWELIPQRQEQFKKLLQIIEDVYRANSFCSIETPTMEYKEILLAKSQGETTKQIFQLTKGNKEYVLKYDNTVPLSRYVAQHYNDISFPFKAYQIEKVYRAEKPQKGRFREFYQADIDIIGNERLSVVNDAFVIKTITNVLEGIGVKNYMISLNNRKIMQGIMEYFGIEKAQEDVFGIIDKYDKLTCIEVQRELERYINLDIVNQLMKLLSLEEEDVMEYLKSLMPQNKLLEEGVKELEQVMDVMEYLEVPKTNYMANLSIIRGLDYYTGTIFETTIKGYEGIGSIASGGRYENLSSTFIKKSLPGVGGSIGVSRLFICLEQAGLLENLRLEGEKYLIVPIGVGLSYPIEILKKLQSKRLDVDMYFEDTKLAKTIKYATEIKVNYLIFVGSEEVENRKLKIKNLETRKEYVISFEELDVFRGIEAF